MLGCTSLLRTSLHSSLFWRSVSLPSFQGWLSATSMNMSGACLQAVVTLSSFGRLKKNLLWPRFLLLFLVIFFVDKVFHCRVLLVEPLGHVFSCICLLSLRDSTKLVGTTTFFSDLLRNAIPRLCDGVYKSSATCTTSSFAGFSAMYFLFV